MDELDKLKNAWSIDDYDSELGQYTPAFRTPESDIPTVKPLYGGSEEFGEIAPKNEGLHSFDIENSLEKIRNLQSGSITPSQAWATGLMGLVPGLLGLAVGGNEGAADGFNIGSKVVGGYTDNIQKNNLQQAQTESALVRDAINEKQWRTRTDYQDTLQRDRAKEHIEAQKGLLKWKGEEGFTRDYNDPSQGGSGKPSLSPETNLELQDALIKGEASPELKAKIFAEVGPYGGAAIFNTTGLNVKRPDRGDLDVLKAQKTVEQNLVAMKELLSKMPEGGMLDKVKRGYSETFDVGSPENIYSGIAEELTFQLAKIAQGSGQGLSNADRAAMKKLGDPSLVIGSPSQAKKVLEEVEKIGNRVISSAVEVSQKGGRNMKPFATEGFQGEISQDPNSPIDELATAKSLAELDGQKVVDETVDNGVVNEMTKRTPPKKLPNESFEDYVKRVRGK